jgi:S1-C subfamily serine protease
MKLYSQFIILLFCFSKITGQAPSQNLLPNSNSMQTTYNFFSDTLSGTCFAISDSTNEFIITAKHLFRRVTQSGDSILVKININKIETLFHAKVFFHSNPLIDLAALKLNKKISQTKTLNLKDGDSYFLGQDCFFLGYPLYNIGTIFQNSKIPFIKKCIISALYEENGIDLILLDGHNNPGFSGGPIITYSDKMENQFIIGVVSGYIYQLNDIKLGLNSNNSIQQTIRINENSGIIIAYPSKYIKEIINSLH